MRYSVFSLTIDFPSAW